VVGVVVVLAASVVVQMPERNAAVQQS